MRRINIQYNIGLLFVVMAVACTGSQDSIKNYTDTVKEELAKGKRSDSLLLGIKFGMTSKAFFAHCWELNKKGILTDGANNTAVLYQINKGLKYPAAMNFYPAFYQDKAYKMTATFQYNAWAPWNKPLFSDSLLVDVLQLFKNWYGGNKFIQLTDARKGIIYVKVDGNRRITVGRYDDMIVKVDYTDLTIEQIKE